MSEYVIITDSSSDFPADVFSEYAPQVIPMLVHLDNSTFEHYPDFRNCSKEAFYAALKEGKMASTTQINPQTYLDLFSPILSEGKDILYICLSSGLSSTYQSSLIAAKELKQVFPKRTVCCVDSLGATGGEGLLTSMAMKNRQMGMPLQANYEWCREQAMHIHYLFTVDDLMFLKRGGRISASTAVIGSALRIKPLLYIDAEGHLVNAAKAHGRLASIRMIAEQTKMKIIDPHKQIIWIAEADCMDDAKKLAQLIQEEIHPAGIKIMHEGPVIGCHTGPGLLAAFFTGVSR